MSDSKYDSYGFSKPVVPDELPEKRQRKKFDEDQKNTPKWAKRPKGIMMPVEQGRA